MLRRALIEATQHAPAGRPLRRRKDDILARRGAQARNIARAGRAARCSPGSSMRCATARPAPRPPPSGAGRVSRPGRGQRVIAGSTGPRPPAARPAA